MHDLGSESPADARFCMHCAAPLAQRCAECGAEAPTGARFCPQCGAARADSRQSRVDSSRFSSAGTGRIVGVVGEPGIGKSRERCRARGITTYEARGVAHGKAIPFLPILQLFAVVRGLIEARGQLETTVTLLEDLHWFDAGSEAFLEPLLDAPPGTRTDGAQASSEIEAALREAQALVEETGGRSQEPFIHAELAELARLRGDEATCQRELREAHRFFTELGATGHAERISGQYGEDVKEERAQRKAQGGTGKR